LGRTEATRASQPKRSHKIVLALRL
jgi:hypothetical protein